MHDERDGGSEVKLRPREEAISKRWADKTLNVPVNNQQYSFDSLARQEEFNRSLCKDDEELSRYLAYRSEWYRRAKELEPGDMPLAVTCELVSCCNLNCTMCYTRTEEFQASAIGSQRVLPWAIVRRIIDECAQYSVPSLLLSWRGESTIYNSADEDGKIVTFPDVIAYARKKGILEITSLTNGQLLDDKMIRAIVDAEPSWISISIDGLEKSYNKIRMPADKTRNGYNPFKLVTANIRKLVAYRDSLNKKRPQIRTNTIYPPIADNPMAYYEFMKGLGVGWVTVNEMLDFRGEKLPEDAVLDKWICQYPFQRLTVSANGSILPCTGAHNEEEELVLGRYPGTGVKQVITRSGKKFLAYEEVSLREAWHSEKLEKIRSMHRESRRKEIFACRHCRHGAVKHGATWIPEDWDMENMEWKEMAWRE